MIVSWSKSAFYFFCWSFILQTLTVHRAQGEQEGPHLFLSIPLPPIQNIQKLNCTFAFDMN